MSSLFDEPTASMGGPDGRYVRLLQNGSNTATLSSGFRVELGDGTATPFGLCSDGIIIFSAGGFRSVVGSSASKGRVQMIADGDGVLYPKQAAMLAADVSSTITTQAAVAGFNVALEANGFYHFELSLLVKVAATTTGFQFALTGPAETTWITYEASHVTTATLTTGNRRTQMLNAYGTTVAVTDSPVATPNIFEVVVRGRLQMGASAPTSQIGITIASEVNASQVTLVKGSMIEFEKKN